MAGPADSRMHTRKRHPPRFRLRSRVAAGEARIFPLPLRPSSVLRESSPRPVRTRERSDMANVLDSMGKKFDEPVLDARVEHAGKLLTALVDPKAYVGEVYSLGYEEALVQIHDFHRKQVGGIPALSFLIATRIAPDMQIDVREEDASVILLRVLDHADLPNAQEALRVRVETAQRVSGELDRNWDHKDVMDPTTHHLLSYAGVRCRVIGTFYVANLGTDETPEFRLAFGSDLSNY